MTTQSPLYCIVDEPDAGTFTLENFVENNEGLSVEDIEEIRDLRPGEHFCGGGGAAAEWAIRRVS